MTGRSAAVRRIGRAVSPSRRRFAAQWRRIDRAVSIDVVQDGPFAGMRLGHATTGSDIPKRLGCYEAELHPLVESWAGYDRVIDIGCGEGWYVVGLARRLPDVEIIGYDVAPQAQRACRAMAELNGVAVTVRGEATHAELQSLITDRTLLIVDIEGDEVDVLDPDAVPALRRADILVELHDFLRPGATEAMVTRFAERQAKVIAQTPRNPAEYPLLSSLDPSDRARALDESRPPDQCWLWLPAAR